MSGLDILIKDINETNAFIKTSEGRVLKSERVFKASSMEQANDLVLKEYIDVSFDDNKTGNIIEYFINEDKVAEFNKKDGLLTFFDDDIFLDEKNDSMDEEFITSDTLMSSNPKEMAPDADYYKNIVLYGKEPYKKKAWTELLKQKYTMYHLTDILEYGSEPYKELAWNVLKKNKKDISYFTLRNIIKSGEEPYADMAWNMVTKKKK
jgi:hypothetical protein